MFIDLLDVLRCPEPHEDTWLVGTFDAMEGRDVVRGTLGCPICRAQYPVRNRVVFLGGARAGAPPGRALGAADPDAPARLGGMLGLLGGGGIAVLGGAWGVAGRPLADLVAELQVVLVNAPEGAPLGQGVSSLLVGERLPLAAGSCRGIALDPATTSPPMVASAAAALRPRGRLVAPVSTPIPEGLAELARDEHVLVAERQGLAGTAPIGLVRARRDESGGGP